MKVMIVYDSAYGNTAKIAKAIAVAVASPFEAVLRYAGEATAAEVVNTDLLLVGSPTQGGRPLETIQNFLRDIPPHGLKSKHVAAFDTRFAAQDHGIGLRLLMHTIGYAADRIAKSLQNKGGVLVAKPEGFIVVDQEGPLRPGELERAARWLNEILRGLTIK